MKNHVYKSLIRPLTVAAVPFDWLVLESMLAAMTALWTGSLIVCFFVFLVAHVWAVIETRKDPQWIALYMIRGRHLKKKERTKRYLA